MGTCNCEGCSCQEGYDGTSFDGWEMKFAPTTEAGFELRWDPELGAFVYGTIQENEPENEPENEYATLADDIHDRLVEIVLADNVEPLVSLGALVVGTLLGYLD